MNPIIAQMTTQSPMVDMLQQLYSVMAPTQNPIAALGQMASNDSRMQQAMDSIRQNGGIQQAVYAEAQRRNINPNDALNQARQILQTFKMK